VADQLQQLLKATKPDEIVDVRKSLLAAYNRFGTRPNEFQTSFARAMAAQGKALLAGDAMADDKLRTLKEINLAIAAHRMSQATIQPLIEQMVAHGDPAVRYFGWSGYALLRLPLMAKGGKGLVQMYDTLSKAMVQETDPKVLDEVVGMFRLSPALEDKTRGVTDAAYRAGQEKLFEILQAHWNNLCVKVTDADPAVAEAAYSAIGAVGLLTIGLGPAVDKKVPLQMTANMAWCAGKGYDLALQWMDAAQKARELAAAAAAPAGGAATTQPAAAPRTGEAELDPMVVRVAARLGRNPKTLGQTFTEAERAVSASNLLLTECERMLNQATGSKESIGKRYIYNPLNRANISGDRGLAVQNGVEEWIGELIRNYGVRHPKDIIKLKAPAATAPAETTE